MRKSLLLWVLIFSLLSTFVIGCGGDDDDDDDDSTGPVLSGLADFADTWYALAEKSTATPIWGYPEVEYRTLDIMEDATSGTYLYTSAVRTSSDYGVATWEVRSNVNYLILTSSVDQSITEIIVNDFDEDFAELEYPGTTTNVERMFVRSPGIYGVVDYDATSTPAANVTVSLAFQGTEIATATTNAWGVYAFQNGLTDGNTYYASVNVEGYNEASTGVYFEESWPSYGHLSLVQQGGTTGTITGTITDAVSGEAINGVSVTLDGTNTVTGSGFYNFSNVAYGSHTITATMSGYQDYSATVILDGATVTQNIVMTPEGSSATLSIISMGWLDGSTADYDLHVLTPEIGGTAYDIYYSGSSNGSLTEVPYAEHQGDRTTGTASPEEVFFSQVYSGTYTVFAKRYGTSNVFSGEGLFATFADTDGNFVESVNANYATGSGEYWIIATITNGIVTEVNEITNTDPVGGGSSNPELADVQLLWPSSYDIDLDLHILTPYINGTEYDVYYGDEGSFYSAPYMEHQGDDTGDDGMEEVLVNSWEDGSYTIYARNWSVRNFDETGALVKIFDVNGDAEYIYASSASGSATWDYWHVADVNGSTNQITVVNEFKLTTPTTEKGFQGALEVSSK